VRILVGADERNELTDFVAADLGRRGHDVELVEPARWPDVAKHVAGEVSAGRADQGVLACWTGTGTAMAANKVPGVRAALCWEPWIAEGARRWNDANVLVLSFKRIDQATAAAILDAWLAVETPDPDEAENIERLAALDRGRERRA
jgi:ribose 5-phosphate isomerase B